MGFIPYLIRRIKIVGANGKDKWGSIILPKLNSIGWRYVQFKFIGLEECKGMIKILTNVFIRIWFLQIFSFGVPISIVVK